MRAVASRTCARACGLTTAPKWDSHCADCAELHEGYTTGKRLVVKAAADYHLQPVVPNDMADL